MDPAQENSTWITSRLLPEALSGIDAEQRIAVLDLGPGDASTVTFLGQFNTHVFFLDLLDNSEMTAPPADLTLAEAIEICKKNIDIPKHILFDVVLLWDLLHHLSPPMLEALSATLQANLHRGTRGYGFGALHTDQPMGRNQFGVAAFDKLVSRPPTEDVPLHPYSQQRLSEHFLCMRIAKGTLLREGRLEMLFEAN